MSKKDGIILHPEYGVNPTVMLCYYCHEEKGVALLGAGYKGEAPHRSIVDIEPCEACDEKYKDYVLAVEMDDDRNPTGNWIGIPKDDVTLDPMPRVALISQETFDEIHGKCASVSKPVLLYVGRKFFNKQCITCAAKKKNMYQGRAVSCGRPCVNGKQLDEERRKTMTTRERRFE